MVGLINTELTNIGLTNVGLTNIGLTNVGLTNTGLTHVGLTNTVLINVGLTNTGLTYIGLTNVGLINTGLTNVGLTNVGCPQLRGGFGWIPVPRERLALGGCPHQRSQHQGLRSGLRGQLLSQLARSRGHCFGARWSHTMCREGWVAPPELHSAWPQANGEHQLPGGRPFPGDPNLAWL